MPILRSFATGGVAMVMLMSSVSFAFAGPSPEAIRQLRADHLAKVRVADTSASSSLTTAASAAETPIAVRGTSWYTDVNGVRHFDGYFGNSGSTMYQDVWVMIEFKDAASNTVGTESVLANEYVVEGEGSWSASFSNVPAGTTHAQAMVFGKPTTRMGQMPVAFSSPSTHVLPGADRHFDGNVTFGMAGMVGDPVLTDLRVSIAEFHMGEFHDVAVAEQGASSSIMNPGAVTAWRAWAPRPADMSTDRRFVNYSAVEYSTIVAKASTGMPAYNTAVTLSGKVRSSTGAPVADMPVTARESSGVVAASAVTAADGTYSMSVKPKAKTTYNLVALGDSYVASAVSAAITIKPAAALTRPGSPSTAYVGKAFTSSGYLKPGHTAGTYPVRIKAYRKIGGKWVLKKTIKAKASNYSSYTKYRARVTLPSKGSWKLVAFHDSTVHHSSKSRARYLTVK